MKIRRSVRRVAVGAFHQAFRYPVVRGKREGGADVAVALVAEVGLILFEQATIQPAILFGQRRQGEELCLRALDGLAFRIVRRRDEVRCVAILAGDAVQRVAGMIELRLLFARLMTFHTAGGIRLRFSIERKVEFVRRG